MGAAPGQQSGLVLPWVRCFANTMCALALVLKRGCTAPPPSWAWVESTATLTDGKHV